MIKFMTYKSQRALMILFQIHFLYFFLIILFSSSNVFAFGNSLKTEIGHIVEGGYREIFKIEE